MKFNTKIHHVKSYRLIGVKISGKFFYSNFTSIKQGNTLQGSPVHQQLIFQKWQNFPFLENFSVFGKKKFSTFGKKVVVNKFFSHGKKGTMLGFPKPKSTYTAYFLATFDRGKKNLTVAFLIYGLIYFPFSEKIKSKNEKPWETGKIINFVTILV